MTYGEFKTAVLSFLDADATRRGIEALRNGFIRGAVADLKHFVPCYQDAQSTYADGDLVPFDERAAEAAAEYVKSKLVLRTERDVSLSREFMAEYIKLRRQLVRLCAEGVLTSLRLDIECFCGDDRNIAIKLIRDGVVTDPTGKVVRFTVKESACDDDASAILSKSTADVGTVITFSVPASGIGNVALKAADTGLLVPEKIYYYDIAVFDGDVKTTFRYGRITTYQRITRE